MKGTFVKESAHNNFFEKMSNKEKSICIVEFSDKKADGQSWSEKFLSHGKCKDYKKPLVSSTSISGVHKIPMQKE